MASFRELFGESWKPEMTLAEAEPLFAGKRLADLSSGEYVAKAKYDADTKRLGELQAAVDGHQAVVDKAVREAQAAAKAEYDKQLDQERTAEKRKRALEKAYAGLTEEQRGIFDALIKHDDLKLSEDGESFTNFDELAKSIRDKYKTVFPIDADGSKGKGGLPPTGDKSKIDDYSDYKKLR